MELQVYKLALSAWPLLTNLPCGLVVLCLKLRLISASMKLRSKLGNLEGAILTKVS